VSVVNYKGGVGKTTLTANLGAGLAARGNRVVLIDLDPQASLTYSFFTPLTWKERLADERTIKKWYDSPSRGKAVTQLADLVVTPERVNNALPHGGRVDMIVSHQDLVSVDVLLAGAVDVKTGQVQPSRFIQVYRRLADGLRHPSFPVVDYVLIDCAPNFQMMTKNAVIASDFVLIPSRPDYLSINGINDFANRMFGLINDYNMHARRSLKTPAMQRPREKVLFTMVSVFGGTPIDAQALAMDKLKALGAPTLRTFIRDRRTVYPTAPEIGVPAVLTNSVAADEINELLDEILKWMEGSPL
jgi:chromosome partitioning protein